jgi:hypothetical protein
MVVTCIVSIFEYEDFEIIYCLIDDETYELDIDIAIGDMIDDGLLYPDKKYCIIFDIDYEKSDWYDDWDIVLNLNHFFEIESFEEIEDEEF